VPLRRRVARLWALSGQFVGCTPYALCCARRYCLGTIFRAPLASHILYTGLSGVVLPLSTDICITRSACGTLLVRNSLAHILAEEDEGKTVTNGENCSPTLLLHLPALLVFARLRLRGWTGCAQRYRTLPATAFHLLPLLPLRPHHCLPPPL